MCVSVYARFVPPLHLNLPARQQQQPQQNRQ